MKKKKGISLIVLIVTIIVIIILAAAVILTLNKNNTLSSAKEAVFRQDIATMKEELEIYKANITYKGENPETLNADKKSDPSVQEIITSMSNKYANIFKIEKGKLAYIGKNKDEYLIAKDMDLIPEGTLFDDDMLEELRPFITEWTVDAGDSIQLPLMNHVYIGYNFTVDYGDGTGEYKITSAKDENKVHTYKDAGVYTVTIKGKCSVFEFSKDSTSKDKITKIVQWGNVFNKSTWNGVDFLNCTNLRGKIPSPSKNSFAKITYNWQGIFNGCKNIEGPIPSDFFANCTPDTVNSAFFGCENLAGSIPEDLFINCDKVTSFGNIFSNCKSLTGNIPENLFKNCKNVTSFKNTFYGCNGLTGSIPENLFANCPEVEIFGNDWWGGCFCGCENLTGKIPENLFKNNKKVKNFHGVFRGCKNLTGSIPENLFSNCLDAENFWWTFYGCSGLTGSIPENLFANNSKVKSFAATFAYCRNLTGSIPENLFANCPEVTQFAYVYMDGIFARCSGLTGSIPENLFKYNTKVKTFCGAFFGCENLTGNIPENLFVNNTDATDFSHTFRDCSNLTGTPPPLWERQNITNSGYCFIGCNLLNLNEVPKSWGGNKKD